MVYLLSATRIRLPVFSRSFADDAVKGVREFVVGTGHSEVRNSDAFGVIKLTLHPNSYDWKFIPEAGKPFTDSGSQACH